ncbi:MAG: glutamyl-tRNA(Gln) amidotransferase subunit D [Candidatus Edwardsbacteria bacterium RifOxyA12_full_54_48]|uniref:Glutamyl-tRNA(Gln) amidotransferase subunit D n=1 Tax=Candidatus Edwardsbacteria bacterium GWF2_54_11 TaxID=1817851 RepID=A0A1F5RC06_9BACT|nr:MAG: glutamyl-tRNA(Gln) amidotransferase subunit D [Candidatus Edwardsbacteria bacterium RifOxyC12_full_54_24]OGF07487.1 MAG: glutamyl-tRNA(Gln) amidotransferase subunit D [Candidatus Edwardsbacteria bacterium RifOxyA12_full_54_48]OGF09737.1 MAG: glutamyl-tRNA(Gln) amidotransferase subunit D [Candidatus Edwardsbacteria bacterium GWE2_54_12]OGF12000.1 MAG: glutamyl-tRNA(Gln) amidotransferase subunit D [Candidatus Edwardsbacteria bacterium GWF2_54_11]OGJ19575.1 MAG: glutamyl-tRNA(Gln) amidotra
MTEDIFQGYKGAGLEVLKKFNVRVWGQAEVVTSRGDFKGTVLPRSENDDDQHIVLKIATGYNIGIDIATITGMTETGYKKANYKIPEKEFPITPGLPRVKLLGTGGTIASRLDYRTGAVIPAFTPGELYGAVPELADICNLTTDKLFAVFSENMGPEQYKTLAVAIGKEIENGIDGIVIGHGTDTLHYTAAALTFMVQNPPVPIVLVGSQRSSDRPSSDAALNLMHATTAAGHGDIAEVMVCMFGPTSDEYGFLHRGTRVRKMHSSYRSTFRTIGDTPLATVTRQGVRPIKPDYHPRRKDRQVTIKPYFEEKIGMIYYYTNMQPDMIDSMVDAGYKGIIIIGTGLGHVNKPLYPAIERAVAKGVHIFMTVQTLWGYVHMFVYDTGRDLMAKGVVPLENMLPEAAYIKLGWVLGQTQDREEVNRMMLAPVSDETTPREPYNGYLIYQGGVPEVEEFIKKFHK